MLLKLPFKTIGDIARHGLELHVYCPSCYATREVSIEDTRWRARFFATARFRCTGQRYLVDMFLSRPPRPPALFGRAFRPTRDERLPMRKIVDVFVTDRIVASYPS
jgi:hypothetical protein